MSLDESETKPTQATRQPRRALAPQFRTVIHRDTAQAPIIGLIKRAPGGDATVERMGCNCRDAGMQVCS